MFESPDNHSVGKKPVKVIEPSQLKTEGHSVGRKQPIILSQEPESVVSSKKIDWLAQTTERIGNPSQISVDILRLVERTKKDLGLSEEMSTEDYDAVDKVAGMIIDTFNECSSFFSIPADSYKVKLANLKDGGASLEVRKGGVFVVLHEKRDFEAWQMFRGGLDSFVAEKYQMCQQYVTQGYLKQEAVSTFLETLLQDNSFCKLLESIGHELNHLRRIIKNNGQIQGFSLGLDEEIDFDSPEGIKYMQDPEEKLSRAVGLRYLREKKQKIDAKPEKSPEEKAMLILLNATISHRTEMLRILAATKATT